MYTREQIEAEGLDDFRVFLIQVWAFLGLPRPTPVQLDMAWWLQHGPRRVILQAFRGVGKSWMTATYALWCLFMDQDYKVEIISASGGLAEDISKFMRDLTYEMPLLQHLKPDTGRKGGDKIISWTVSGAKVSKDPSVKAVGITGQITGTRADLIISDDVEVPKNSFTHHLREKLRNQVKEYDAILKPGGRVIYLGTPQVEESLYPHVASKVDQKTGKNLYATRIWTVEIPQNPNKYGDALAPYIKKQIKDGAQPGDPVDPDRFDEFDIAERKASYGMSGFNLQFMLDTELSSAEKHPLKLSDLIVYDVDRDFGPTKIVWSNDRRHVLEELPAGGFTGDRFYRPAWISDDMVKWQGTVLAIDPAGRGKDELAFAVVKHLHGMLYLCEVQGFSDGFDPATLQAIANAAGRWNVNAVITEKNFGGGMFDQLIQPYLVKVNREACLQCAMKGKDTCPHKAGLIDEEYNGWATGQKEKRILNVLEPVTQQHRLVVNRQVIEDDVEIQGSTDRSKYSLVHQYTRMEDLKGALSHEDRLEAVAMAVGYFTDRMAVSQDEAHRKHHAKLLDRELRDFYANAMGQKPRKNNSFTSF